MSQVKPKHFLNCQVKLKQLSGSMAGAGGFPSLVSVLRHVHEFASFPECGLFFSSLVEFLFLRSIFHMVWTPDLKGTLKIPCGSSKAPVLSAQAIPQKLLYILNTSILRRFLFGRTCSIPSASLGDCCLLSSLMFTVLRSSVPACRNRT